MLKAEKSSWNLKKLSLRIFLLLVLLIVLFVVSFVLLGYYGASKPISYLPEIHPDIFKSHSNGLKQIELKNSRYVLIADDKGKISVKTTEGDLIMSDLFYYASHEGTKEKWGLDSISVTLCSDSTISVNGKGPGGVKVNILLTVPVEGSRLDINIKTLYTSNSVVKREALVGLFEVPVSEVYKKNRQVDNDSFDSEYWLQRQGVKFGSEKRSAMVYHTPGISSLQLDTRSDLLFFNLEYSMDHPHINIPYQEDGGGKWEDQSTADYHSGQERDNYFSIYFSDLPKSIPRLMLVPDGYLAGYVFTEHADGGNIRTHRAVYFGSDTITKAKNAVGGFVGNKIPVTKSVFYADPKGNKYLSIRDDPNYPQFLDFLDQLNGTGMYEICLHTPENSTSNRRMLEESIKFMKERFDAVTWIDHGFYTGKFNRECICADGLNANSECYAADLWEKYGTRYFWSTEAELIKKKNWEDSPKKELKRLKLYSASVGIWREFLSSEELKKMNFYSSFVELLNRYPYEEELNSLQPVKGNSYPTPLSWQHPSRTRLFYSWVTDYSYENGSKRLWTNKAKNQLELELKNLEKLLINQGVFISHGYYIRNSPGEDITGELNGKVTLNPYFEKILEYMSEMRDTGSLYLTTIRGLLNYWILTENISFKYMPGGEINIYNNNDKPIYGLSLIIQSSGILVNGEIPKFKRVGDDTIFWFDIQAKDYVVLKIPSNI